MQDNQLIILIISLINGFLTQQGVSATVQQTFQPTKQGVITTPAVFLYKVSDHRHGWVRRDDSAYDSGSGDFIHSETQFYESTFQISTLSIQDPTNTTQMTASDLANLISMGLQSSYVVWHLQQNGVGIERITDVRNPYFQDDMQRNEASPSFDFVLTYTRVITSAVPILDPIEESGIFPI